MTSVSKRVQIVILAGGLATRLGHLTEATPKSMIHIGGKPFLQYQLELLVQNGITDVVLCVGHLAHCMEEFFGDGSKFGVDIKYSVEKGGLLGTAGALKNAEPLLADEFLVMYGDSYLLLDYAQIAEHFRRMNRLGMMVVYRNFDRYDSSNTVLGEGLVRIYDKQKRTDDMVYIDEGITALKKCTLEYVPQNELASLEMLYRRLIAQNELAAFETEQRFYEIGSICGLEEFRSLVCEGGISR